MRAAGQPRHVGDRLGRVGGLAEHVAVDGDDRVRSEHQGVVVVAGQRLAARVLRGDRLGRAVHELVDAGGRDPERHAHLREDRAPLRRRGRED